MFKKYKWLLLCLIGIAIIGYCIFHHIRYSPHLNPHPKYFVTIKGTVSPQLQDKIRFYITYGSTAKRCVKQGFNINYDLGKGIDIKPKFDKNNIYELVIPLDKYNLGWCNWSAYAFGYYFIQPKHKKELDVPVILFGNETFSKSNKLDLSCKANSPECSSINLFKDNGMLFKPSAKNYTISINFKGKFHAESN